MKRKHPLLCTNTRSPEISMVLHGRPRNVHIFHTNLSLMWLPIDLFNISSRDPAEVNKHTPAYPDMLECTQKHTVFFSLCILFRHRCHTHARLFNILTIILCFMLILTFNQHFKTVLKHYSFHMALFPSGISWGKKIDLNSFSLMSIAKYQEKCPTKIKDKAYQYFLEQYIHDIWISEKREEKLYIKAKCFASQRKDIHNLHCCIKWTDGSILGGKCSCKAG